MPKLYPRLEEFEYETKIKYVENIMKNGDYEYFVNESELVWLPIGNRVSIKDLKTLRKNVKSFVQSNITINTPSQELTKFDKALSQKLLDWLDITPSIAADTGMWAYLNIMLIPDVIKIRWGYDDKGKPREVKHDRYYHSNRAYLKKLWFSAYMLNDPELSKILKPDQMDHWYDKTSTRGYSNYINIVYITFNELTKKYNINTNLQPLFREYLKAVNRKLAYVNYFALSDDDFIKLATIAFEDCEEIKSFIPKDTKPINSEQQKKEVNTIIDTKNKTIPTKI